MRRFLLGLILIAVLLAGGAWFVAGRMAPPSITIDKPEKFVGLSTPLEVTISAPEAASMSPLSIVLEQNGKQVPIFSLAAPGKAQLKQDGTDKLHITQDIGKQTIPDLQSGNARIIVTAGRRGALRDSHRSVDGHSRRAGPAGAAARVGGVDPSLRQPGRNRDGRVPGDA